MSVATQHLNYATFTIKPDKNHIVLKYSSIETPLGTMFTIGDDKGIYLLEFADKHALKKEIEKLQIQRKASIIPGTTCVIQSIQLELQAYFSGKLRTFNTPIHMLGTSFQQEVWYELLNTPYGKTRSYLSQAKSIDKHKSVRAVANANAANQLAIIIPCHRIINNNGKLGGYSGGLARKKWLISHEQNHQTTPS